MAHLFDFRAKFIEPARSALKVLPVQIGLPDGTIVTSDQADHNRILSKALNREVTLCAAQHERVTAEEYWPDMETETGYRNHGERKVEMLVAG